MLIEESLLLDCQNNKRRAQFELYHKCFGILMSICLRYHRNRSDAEEVLNMGFLKIVTKLDKYNSDVPFEAWIRRIMINTIIDEFRKNKKAKAAIEYTDFNGIHESNSVSFNEADLSFEAEELENMIQTLPPVSQKVFNMHVIDGYSHKEVAEKMNISVGTSKWHVSNARKLLRKMIEDVKSTTKYYTTA
jgi:RNA polymerase sigma-70 factor (ECF subfamily)